MFKADPAVVTDQYSFINNTFISIIYCYKYVVKFSIKSVNILIPAVAKCRKWLFQ